LTCKIIRTWRNRVIDVSQNDVKSDVEMPEKAVCSKVCFVAIFLSVLRIFRKEKQIRKVESILFLNMSISLKSKDGPKTAQTVPCPKFMKTLWRHENAGIIGFWVRNVIIVNNNKTKVVLFCLHTRYHFTWIFTHPISKNIDQFSSIELHRETYLRM